MRISGVSARGKGKVGDHFVLFVPSLFLHPKWRRRGKLLWGLAEGSVVVGNRSLGFGEKPACKW